MLRWGRSAPGAATPSASSSSPRSSTSAVATRRPALHVDAAVAGAGAKPRLDLHELKELLAQMQSSISAHAVVFFRSLSSRLAAPSQLASTKQLSVDPAVVAAHAAAALASPRAAASGAPADSLSAPMQSGQSAPLLQRFLDRADRLELMYATLMADLSDLAYQAENVEDSWLQRHGLTLVSNSARPFFGPPTEAEAAAATKQQPAAVAASQPPAAAAAAPVAAAAAAPVTMAAAAPLVLQQHQASPPQSPRTSRALIARSGSPQRSTDGGSNSSASISPAASPVRRTRSRSPSLASCPSPTRLDALGPPNPLSAHTFAAAPPPAAHQPSRAAGAPRPMAPTVAAPAVTATAFEHKQQQPSEAVKQPAPAAAWFCADDPVTKTRYLVIQGSTSLEHWSINFNFEPVPFEDPALGVRVHRGVYEAAQRLYEDLLPLVLQHLASSPLATVSLGGHSLGGSLASVLMLMLVRRGIARPAQLAPSYTFGAPAVFCAGAVAPLAAAAGDSAAGHPDHLEHLLEQQRQQAQPGALQQQHLQQRAGSSGSEATASAAAAPQPRRSLMERLGIPDDLLMNVMMHKDIVPRAFVCDYTIVADFLKQWMPSFKDHSTLSPRLQHKYLYNYIGRVAVLRPDDNAPFVQNDAAHPMLPDEAGLYKLRDQLAPAAAAAAHVAAAPRPARSAAGAGSPRRGSGGGGGGGSSVATAAGPPGPPLAAAASRAPAPVPVAAAVAAAPCMRSALLQFMNHPHPLQSLSSMTSYGSGGAISRYHNPANYTSGLARLLEPITAQWSHLTLP